MSNNHQSTTPDEDPITTTSITNNNQYLIPNLPNDVALQCLARVPHSHHPFLSLVSKSWHYTLLSPHFHATRLALNSTQNFLFFNIRVFNPKDSTFTFQWCSLDPSMETPKFPKTNHYPLNLIPIKPCPSQPIGASFVSLGHRLYIIGGSIGDIPSNKMWVFDFVSNKWDLGPRMRVGREFAACGVIDGKIYVLGGCVVDNWARSMNWAEVFDPGSGSWAAVPSPVESREKWMHASGVVGGKIYAMADRGGVVFEPGSGDWGPVSVVLDLGWRGRAAVVDEVLYCYDYLGKIRGFDFKDNVWKELKGLDKDLPKFLCGATMANVGGRLFVVWEGKGNGSGNGKEMEVHCAEIVVRKDGCGDLCGSILWSDVIIVVPKGSSIVHCLDVCL